MNETQKKGVALGTQGEREREREKEKSNGYNGIYGLYGR